jgi:hypothetical protein
MTSAPLIYVECDIPAGVTVVEWRRSHHSERRGPAARLRKLFRV